MKKILVIDDSALMRRIIADIFEKDGRFMVAAVAKDGLEALKMLENYKFDCLILDINMPKMNGIEFLEELQRQNKKEKIIVVSTDTADGADVTIKALEKGAMDFIQKPQNILDARSPEFRNHFLALIKTATETSNLRIASPIAKPENIKETKNEIRSETKTESRTETKNEQKLENKEYKTETKQKVKEPIREVVASTPIKKTVVNGKKLVAIACSTGGPNALQHIIPYIPANLDAPVVIVQHMPMGFTKSLAERLDDLSAISVTEAEENETLKKGHVYIARGGKHLRVEDGIYSSKLYYTDEPAREGVKPAANYMYESLIESGFDEIVCVVLTGMGQDGRIGIQNLAKENNIYVIAQSEQTCTVFGMPRAVITNGLADEVVDLDSIAQKITQRIGTC